MRCNLWILTLSLLAAAPASAEEPTYAGLLAAENALFRELEAEVPNVLREAEVPGLQVAVAGPGGIRWSAAFGVRSTAGGGDVTLGTTFEAASLSKPVFAYLVMLLAEQGRIDLELPLAETLDEPRATHDPRALSIRPTTILRHASGLPNWGGEQLELSFDPDDGFGYSGEGYVWLQRVVEEQTGRSLEVLAEELVFAPLGMARSSFVWGERFAEDVASGHGRSGSIREIRREGRANAAASLLTTATDYAKFVHAVWRGEGLSEDHRRLLTETRNRPTSEEGGPVDSLGWSLGWGILESEKRRVLWHWGDNGAFRAFVALDLASGATGVYFANSENGLQLVERLLGPIVGNLVPVTEWLGHGQFDDTDLVTLRSLRRAFEAGGTGAGAEALRAALRDRPEVVDGKLVERLSTDLVGRGRPALAEAALREAVAQMPGSAAARAALGRHLVAQGRWVAGHEELTRAEALDPENEAIARAASWARDLARVAAEPVELELERLEALAGTYGPRTLRLEQGRLVYSRRGRDPFPLVPLGSGFFALEGEAEFRIRIEADASGRGSRIVGLYLDGGEDATERSD